MTNPPSPFVKALTGLILQFVVYGLLVYTWYIYVFRICVALLIQSEYPNIPAGAVLIAFATIFVFMASICYTRIIYSDPGHPDKMPSLQAVESGTCQESQSLLPRYCYTPSLFDKTTMTSRPLQDAPILPALSISEANGMARFCNVCQCVKPDRTHHCSDCNICVLKMDHHCPWINGCVGYRNYKFFFLFVSYTGLYGLWGLCSTIPLVVIAIRDHNATLDPQWVVFLVIAFVFGMTVCGFSLAHGQYILVNRTTIESLSTRPDYVRVDFDTSGHNYEVVNTSLHDRFWNVGKMDNWKSVMGKRPIGWFLPVYYPPGDGKVFPYNDLSYHKMLDQAKQQNDMI